MSRRAHRIEVRRVYDHDLDHGSSRWVLVDRLWPRGIAKADLELDEWLKDVAPSTELRRWYGHDVDRFDEFARRYRAELHTAPGSAAVGHLVELAGMGDLTLLTATKDVAHSGAIVVHQELSVRLKNPTRPATKRKPAEKKATKPEKKSKKPAKKSR